MRTRVISPHSNATALWRLSLLSVVAIAVGAGIFVLARRSAERSAETAELSFDSSVAARNDAAVAHATEPALTVAQSILTETTVLDLLRQVGAKSSNPTVSIGEFRSRLDLQQPSDGMLRVFYHDTDPRTARKVANAVASAIVDWNPAESNPPAVAPPQISSVPALPARAHASARPPGEALRTAYTTLAVLEGQLTATDEKIGDLSQLPASPSQTPNAAPPPTAPDEQRQILQAKLAAAHQRLDDLRLRYTDEYPDVESTKDAISDLQQELAALPPATAGSSEGNGTSDAEKHDTQIADLRQHRAWLAGQIAAEKRAIVDIRPNPASQRTSPPLQTASIPPTAPGAASPAPAMTEIADWQNPFRIIRLTSVTRGSLAWPAILASGLCILFYFVSAVCLFELWRHSTQFLQPAPISQAHSSFAFDSQVPAMKPPPPAQAPIAEEPDRHVAKEPAWKRTSEAAPQRENKGISQEQTEQQSIHKDVTGQEVLETELIEVPTIEGRVNSLVRDVSEVELTSREGSKAKVKEPEPIETFLNPGGPLVSAREPGSEAAPSSAVEAERGSSTFEPAEDKPDDQAPRNMLGTVENETEPTSGMNSRPETTVTETLVISQEGVQWNSLSNSPREVESVHTAGAEQEMPATNPVEPPDDDLPEMLDKQSPANLDVDAASDAHSELAEMELQAEMETGPESASTSERETEMISWSKAELESELQASVEKEPSNGEHKVVRHALADCGEVDAAWVARIVEALSQTSSGHKFEVERRGERSNVLGDTSPSLSTNSDATEDAAGPSKTKASVAKRKPPRITDTRKYGS
jgi:hypothetical protein